MVLQHTFIDLCNRKRYGNGQQLSKGYSIFIFAPQFTKKGQNMIKYYKIMQGAEKVESEGFFLLS